MMLPLHLLILLLFVGKEVNGAKSWFNLLGFSFQPSELMKPVAALAIAKYLSNVQTFISLFDKSGLVECLETKKSSSST